MTITRKSLPRLTVLRGLGVTIGLPLLDAMVPAVTALAKTPAHPVHRFQAVYVPMEWRCNIGRQKKMAETLS